ncbi:MAG: c-type cytochrome domain-containing protein, partial [Verrucomicrobiota bacterium]
MNARFTPLLFALLLPSLCRAETVPQSHSEQMKAGLELFSRTIRPALNDHCVQCHGGEKIRGGLDLATREAMLEGGESGMTVDLATPDESLMMILLRHEEEPTMPPKKPKLDDALLDDFERWIKLGAPFDKPLIEGAGASEALVVNDNDRDFWSFRPLSEEAPPESSDPWVLNEIDQFVLAKQQEVDLTPN